MSFLDKLFDNVVATDLATGDGTTVNVGQGAAPTGPGQVLVTTDAEHAGWQAPPGGDGGAAGGLETTGDPINVSEAAPPVAGQVLTATDPEHAVWRVPGLHYDPSIKFWTTTASSATIAPGTWGFVDQPTDLESPGHVTVYIVSSLEAPPVDSRFGLYVGRDVTVPVIVSVLGASQIQGIDGALGTTTELLPGADYEWVFYHEEGVALWGVVSDTAGIAKGLRNAGGIVSIENGPGPNRGDVLTAVGDASYAEWRPTALQYNDLSVTTLEVGQWASLPPTAPDEGTQYTIAFPDDPLIADGDRFGIMRDHASPYEEVSVAGFDIQGLDGYFGSSSKIYAGQYAEWTYSEQLTAWRLTLTTTGIGDATVPPDVFASNFGVAGTSHAPARADHQHAVATSGSVASLTVGGVGTPGASGLIARADHAHGMPGLATGSASGFMSTSDFTKLAGVAAGAAAVGSTNPVGVDGNSSPSVGVSATAARSDHRHVVLTGSPVALTIGGAAADGASNSLARADHAHAMPAAGTPVALTLAGSNNAGVATTLTRSDHVHALPASNVVPTALTVGGSGSAGSATSITKSDHVHGMPGLATQSVSGFMSNTDKIVVDSIPAYNPALNGFRLSPTSDDSIPADGAFSNVFLVAVAGDKLALYTGTTWIITAPSGVGYTLAGRTAGLPFDVFAYWTGSVVALEVLDWASATVRATGLTRQNGVWTKTGDTTRRYLGTVRPRSATTYRVQRSNNIAAGSVGIDYWNVNLKQQTALALADTGGNTAYVTPSFRQWGANTNAQIEAIAGLSGDPVSINAIGTANTSNSTTTLSFPGIGIGIGNATPVGGRNMEGIARIATAPFDMATLAASLATNAPLGVMAYWWLQYGSGGVEFFGVSGPAQSGMMALVTY